jgi:hypothetical protein
MSKSSTYVVTAERAGRRRWPPAITSPEYKESGAPKATNNPHTPDDGTSRRGMNPPEKVVGKNQPSFGELVNIPPEIFTREVVIAGEDEGVAKDELDQIQKRKRTPDTGSSYSFLMQTPPA